MSTTVSVTLAGNEIQHRAPGPWTAHEISGGMGWVANAQGINFLHIPAQPFAKIMTIEAARTVADAFNAQP